MLKRASDKGIHEDWDDSQLADYIRRQLISIANKITMGSDTPESREAWGFLRGREYGKTDQIDYLNNYVFPEYERAGSPKPHSFEMLNFLEGWFRDHRHLNWVDTEFSKSEKMLNEDFETREYRFKHDGHDYMVRRTPSGHMWDLFQMDKYNRPYGIVTGKHLL